MEAGEAGTARMGFCREAQANGEASNSDYILSMKSTNTWLLQQYFRRIEPVEIFAKNNW
jgi:hypothetical protein